MKHRRLGEELTGWQEPFAKSEDNQRQVRMLRQQLETLQAEHVRVIDSDRQMQEKSAASGVTEGVSTPIEDDSTEASTLQNKIPMVAGLPPDLTGSDKATGRLLDSRDSAARTHVAKEVETRQITRAWVFRNWRVGAIFAGVIILVIVCAVTIKTFLMTKAPVSRDPIVFLPEATVEPYQRLSSNRRLRRRRLSEAHFKLFVQPKSSVGQVTLQSLLPISTGELK